MENRLPDTIFIGHWVKKDGKLVFKHKTEQSLFNKLMENMREGQSIEIVIDFSRDDGTLMQISKLKAGIRTLSREVGSSYKDTEERIKRDAGLFDDVQEKYKSFAVCSKDELSDAIRILIDLGEFANLNLR